MMPQTSTHHLVQDSKARKELLHGVFRACDLNGDDWLSEGEFRNIAAWAQWQGKIRIVRFRQMLFL